MTKRSRRPWAVTAAGVTAAVFSAGLVAGPALAAPAPVKAADETVPAGAVTVRPDPSYQGEAFEGWGTSLVWFANATGDYPDEVRNKLADMVFGDDGLNLNIARYNVGGGNAPDVKDYLRAGGAVEGWWKAPAGTTREDKDWWDPANPEHWNLDADQTQRWWVDRIKNDITHWEAFSNSPPWFQTVSGYVSGGFNSSQDQLRTESVDDFSSYLVGVVKRLEKAHGIKIDTIDPMNEPNTPYWGTSLNASGQPVGGRQEGAHMGPELQQKVVQSLAKALASAETGAVISAMDETNPSTFANNWNSYSAEAKENVAQLNVHTYGTGQRTSVRDIAKGEDKPLWMSETGGSWMDGQNFTSMQPGLGLAQHMVNDLRELEPEAWVFWQPVEDYNNMKPGGESAIGSNWGEIQLPFDCAAGDTLESCPIYTNTKYNTARNFTHFIKPGDRLVKVDDLNSAAAVSDSGATVVHVNDSKQQRPVALDLSRFGAIQGNATVTPVTSDASGALVEGEPVAVGKDRTAVLTVPAESVTTFLVNGVHGVAKDAALVQADHVYSLKGVESGKSLTQGTGSTAVIRSGAGADQQWNIRRLSGENSSRARYAIETADGGRQLAVVDGTPQLVPAEATPAEPSQWTMSTTGDGTYTFVNAANDRLLEVGGHATADGSPVTLWTANSGENQRWHVIDETVQGFQSVTAFTVPGTTPQLPATVVPVYRDGARGTLPVTWTMPPESRWSKPGTVEVHGTATDVLGAARPVTARVTVDTLVSTLPARAKTYVGGTPALPATVTAVTAGGSKVERPVVWDAAPAFTETGVASVAGTADAADGRTLPATVRVQVTAGTADNVADDGGATFSASFTEPGYGTAGLGNGNLTDKAWSNWKSGTKNTTDTLSVSLPQQKTVSGVKVHFYRDGSTDSYAQSLQVQTKAADGTWKNAGASVQVPGGSPAPVVTVPVANVDTKDVRVVLAARTNTHMTVSEVQVLATAPGQSSDAVAAGISVNGQPLAGFDPDVTAYRADAQGGRQEVTATAADPYATVTVQPADKQTGKAVVTVKSEDGSQNRTYDVVFGR
ncbi:Ig-like domain-containing protein [Arthrobacter globiformis]|uniref:Ig-like domain-containing protein n=1 Tax=Arthrobacter globiformis TaxID=1665 RepID=UPI00167DDF1F|nr:Ig-like domain-containing protein [Arthrobacter globiformis]